MTTSTAVRAPKFPTVIVDAAGLSLTEVTRGVRLAALASLGLEPDGRLPSGWGALVDKRAAVLVAAAKTAAAKAAAKADLKANGPLAEREVVRGAVALCGWREATGRWAGGNNTYRTRVVKGLEPGVVVQTYREWSNNKKWSGMSMTMTVNVLPSWVRDVVEEGFTIPSLDEDALVLDALPKDGVYFAVIARQGRGVDVVTRYRWLARSASGVALGLGDSPEKAVAAANRAARAQGAEEWLVTLARVLDGKCDLASLRGAVEAFVECASEMSDAANFSARRMLSARFHRFCRETDRAHTFAPVLQNKDMLALLAEFEQPANDLRLREPLRCRRVGPRNQREVSPRGQTVLPERLAASSYLGHMASDERVPLLGPRIRESVRMPCSAVRGEEPSRASSYLAHAELTHQRQPTRDFRHRQVGELHCLAHSTSSDQ